MHCITDTKLYYISNDTGKLIPRQRHVNMEPRPIFNGNVITPQTVRPYQPIFSASFIAHIEATYETEQEKNEIFAAMPPKALASLN